MKKSLGIVVRSGVWVGTAALLLVCLAFARLLLAPVDIGFARDELIMQAEGFLPGWQIDFDQAEVGWDWRSVRPWISITDLRLTDRADRLTASVPRARVGVSFSNILGNPGLSIIELDGANVLVTDLSGFSDTTGPGMFSKLFGEGGVPKPVVFRPVTEAFSRFGARLQEQAPALRNVLLTSSTIEIVRGEAYANARFAVPLLELTTFGDRLVLDAHADIEFGGQPVQLSLKGDAEPKLGELTVAVNFSQMRPSDLRLQAKMPELVTYLDFPVALGLEIELAANSGLRGARFQLEMDEGVISHPVRFPDPASIRFGTIEGFYIAAEEMVVLEKIEVQAGERKINGDGMFQWLDGFDKPRIRLALATEAATIAEVKRYWPVATNPDGTPRGARVWVDQNMIKGRATNVRFNVDWSPATGGAYANTSAFQLDFDVEGIDTRYLRQMPPIMNASGTATLTRQVFDVALETGTVMDMPIAGSTAHMYDIHMRGKGIGEFSVKMEGPVPTIMSLISYDPLRVPQKMNFDAARLNGEAKVDVALQLPLVKGVRKEAVKYDVSARITETRVDDLLGGEGIRQGDFKLRLDPDNLAMEGRAALNGVPVDLYWRESFAAGRMDPKADTTEVVLSGRFDENDLRAFGVDVSDFVEGKATGEGIFIGRNFKFNRGYFTADATGAILKARQLAWRKASSTPATVTGALLFTGTGTSLTPLNVLGENIDLTANFEFGPKDSGIMNSDFTVRNLGGHQFSGAVVQRPGEPTRVEIEAARFNAGAYLAQLDEASPQDAGIDMPRNVKSEDVDISLAADSMLLLNGETLNQVSLEAAFRSGEPKTVSLSGLVPDMPERVVLTVSETGDPAGQAVSLTSPDGGHFFRGLGLFSHLKGGPLTMAGVTSGWGLGLRIAGTAEMKDSLLVDRAALAPGVEEGVVAGLNDFLSGGPVRLTKIKIPFAYDGGILDLSNLKANGPTLGMTMEGQISAREDKINVNGVFVPAYGLNSLLGKIPLVGALLTGGEGKGVFGVSYRVKGQLEAPEFNINPVSGIAPGFLRLLFEGRKGKIADVEIPAKSPDPTDKKQGAEEPGEGNVESGKEPEKGPEKDPLKQPPPSSDDDKPPNA